MPLPDLRPWASLLLLDLALLWLLQGTLGALLPGGLPGLWLEAAVRLGGLWCLLKLRGLPEVGGTLLPMLCLVLPLFLSLRALVPGALSAPPARVASAPWSWLLVGYGAAALSWAVWAILSPPGAPAQETKQGQENKALLWRLLKLSRPDLPFLLAAFFFLVLAVWGETLIPYYSGHVIDILGGDFDPEAFASAMFFMCLFSFGSSLSAGCRGGSFMVTMSRINLRIRDLLFASLLRQDLGFFQETKTALFQALLLEIQDAVAKSGQIVQEAVGGLQTVRSFGAEEHEVCRYKEALERCRKLRWQRDSEQALYELVRRLLQLAVQLLMLNCGLQQILAGELTQGGLLSFLLYQENVGDHVFSLVYMWGDMLSNVGAAEKVFAYLDRQPNMPPSGTRAPSHLEGRVEFHDVSFAYPSRPDQPVLKGLTFTLRPGEVTALVGPNGSGKSTVAALLQNLYQPSGGQVLLDGEPLSQYEHHYLHRKVVLVGQEPVLFSGSVRDNIAYGLENCRDEEVLAAARDAHADQFIAKMEHGMHTEVGEKGSQLAVGQKQCLAIARALVRDPRVLILDEATSALDADCEQALQDWKSRGNRTVLVIAHRLKTVQGADQILVLKNGELQDHAQLIQEQDTYASLLGLD
ncbi:antigen peptide transporter 2-like [Echinops telfairi]|uniref:Antigen peptide transporter 2-like n=1 Tax=Echinops telfairi TaxID=9371 RepID=A0AC55D900_ECHTE|nr:antigen peptide transporter 2-like [Echinops telfairi]